MNEDINASGQNSGSCCCGGGGGKCNFCELSKWAFERALKVVKDPANVWGEIKNDGLSIKDTYLKYVLLLAAIPPVGQLIHSIYSGSFPLVFSIVTYILSLASLIILAYVIKFIAPKFGGSDDLTASFKLAAYSATPSFLAGVFHLIPATGISSVLVFLAGLYGIYLLVKGANPLTNVSTEKTGIFVALVIVAYIVVSIILGIVAAPFLIAASVPSGALSSV